MKPRFSDDTVTLYAGDCREALAELTPSSVDTICTDPPYELGFMGRAWDSSGIAYDVDMWRQCWRALKPGGHLLAFGGTRTYHRLVCAIEDANFEIRDSMHWIYGSGFPKSLDISKAIDKRRDDRDAINEVTGWLARQRDRAGLTNRDIDEAFDFHGMAGHWTAAPHLKIAQVPRWDQWERLRDLLSFDNEMDAEVWRLNGRKGTPGEAWDQREVIGQRTTGIGTGRGAVAVIGDSDNRDLTAPATDDARRWSGFGTALKPAHEPIVLARKPLTGTVAGNVLTHGTGALNIDACRVGWDAESLAKDTARRQQPRSNITSGRLIGGDSGGYEGTSASPAGRWPTNVVLTHQPLVDDTGNIIGDACADGCVPGCPVADMDAQSGIRPSGGSPGGVTSNTGMRGNTFTRVRPELEKDTGGASRFFPVFRYEAKAPSSERPRGEDGTAHATVKPLALMRWLVRLATQPGGVVLDPFLGSGTTAEACVIEGFRCIGIERDESHLPLIKARLSKPIQPALGFEDAS